MLDSKGSALGLGGGGEEILVASHGTEHMLVWLARVLLLIST